MNRKLASTLSVTSTAAAILAVAAIASGNAYAEGPIIDSTPFVSTKSRAEVQAEVTGQAAQLREANSEWAMQLNEPTGRPNSAYTSKAAQAEYIASRDHVNALNGEDSGSFFLSSRPQDVDTTIMAGPPN